MDQEDQSQRFNTSNSGNIIGRSNGKRSKEKKKVPQRGLGVAQLERIRLEEQQKNVPNHHHSYQYQSLSCPLNIPFVYSPNSTFRPTTHNSSNNSFDHLNLPQEFNPIWPQVDSAHMTRQYQQQTFPSMVNVPTPRSLSSSQIEPPSNQIFYGKNYTHISSEQEKMLGNKRAYSFVDDLPGSTFDLRFSTFSLNSCPSERISNPDHSHLISSELGLPSRSSNPVPEPNSKKSIKENNATNGNFLTLSLPTTTTTTTWSTYLSSKFDNSDCEIRDSETIPFQGITGNNSSFEPEPSGSSSSPLMPLYSFFPSPAEKHDSESSAKATLYCTGGLDESIDLDLKL